MDNEKLWATFSAKEQIKEIRRKDKLELKLLLCEILFILACFYHLFWGKESLAIWYALWRIGYVLANLARKLTTSQ